MGVRGELVSRKGRACCHEMQQSGQLPLLQFEWTGDSFGPKLSFARSGFAVVQHPQPPLDGIMQQDLAHQRSLRVSEPQITSELLWSGSAERAHYWSTSSIRAEQKACSAGLGEIHLKRLLARCLAEDSRLSRLGCSSIPYAVTILRGGLCPILLKRSDATNRADNAGDELRAFLES